MRVIVTRPLPQGDATARKVEAMGHRPVLMPLTEIRPLDPGPLSVNPATVAMTVATSANALIHAPAPLVGALRDIPFCGVGAATEHAAMVCGFSDTDHAGGDAVSLAGHVAAHLPLGARLVYLCGRVRKPDLEERLTDAGLETVAIETYGTLQVSYPTEFLTAQFVAHDRPAVLLYSHNAAQRLLALLEQAELAQAPDSMVFFCLSSDIAAPLREAGFTAIRIAEAPTEDALLSALGAAR